MERGDAGYDEGEKDALDDTHPHEPRLEIVLDTRGEILHTDHISYDGGGIGSNDTHGGTEDHQEGHDGDHAENLRQNEVIGGVHPHNVECIDLLGHTHGAQLRGDVRTHLASQYQAHDGRGKLQEHDFARGITSDELGHPWTLDVDLHLYADHGADEERDEQDDADGIDT